MKLNAKRYSRWRWTLIAMCAGLAMLALLETHSDWNGFNILPYLWPLFIVFSSLTFLIVSTPPMSLGRNVYEVSVGQYAVNLPIWRMIWTMLGVIGALVLLSLFMGDLLFNQNGPSPNSPVDLGAFILINSILLLSAVLGLMVLIVHWTRGEVILPKKRSSQILDQEI